MERTLNMDMKLGAVVLLLEALIVAWISCQCPLDVASCRCGGCGGCGRGGGRGGGGGGGQGGGGRADGRQQEGKKDVTSCTSNAIASDVHRRQCINVLVAFLDCTRNVECTFVVDIVAAQIDVVQHTDLNATGENRSTHGRHRVLTEVQLSKLRKSA